MITDKMLEDIFDSLYDTNDKMSIVIYNSKDIKDDLKAKGYEVEESKSKLDEARDYLMRHIINDHHVKYMHADDVTAKENLFLEVIEELKLEIDNNFEAYEEKVDLTINLHEEIKDLKQRLETSKKSRLKLIEDHKKEIANMKRCTNCGIKYGYANPICIECENHSNWTKYV